MNYNLVYYCGKKKMETLVYSKPRRLALFLRSQMALEKRYSLGEIKIEKSNGK